MTMVGIRELKAHLSEYLRRVKKGESLSITEHGKSVALLAPATASRSGSKAWRLVSLGLLEWGGGKPTGLKNRIPARGEPVSESILDDREDRIR
jgi:prevent-host-death family protein